MKKFSFAQLFALLGLASVALLSGCTTERPARDISKDDFRVSAHYTAKTVHENTRAEGSAYTSSWFNFSLPAQDTDGGYFYSDAGSLFSGLSPTQALALRAAIADACRKSDADVLLLPRYNMETKSFWFFYESVRCSVSGFPAKIIEITQVPLPSEPGG